MIATWVLLYWLASGQVNTLTTHTTEPACHAAQEKFKHVLRHARPDIKGTKCVELPLDE